VERLIDHIKKSLQENLPGPEAQAHMSPMQLRDERFLEQNRPLARQGAVLLLLYPHNGRLYLPLMQRPVYEGHHSGQISLPGGKQEPEDKDKIATALREAWEEIGVEPAKVQLIGQLSELYIPPSNYQVLPVVGYTRERPNFVADPVEVAAIIEISLEELLHEKSIQQTYRTLAGGIRIKIPYYGVDEHVVWGATAMILSEFLAIVRTHQ
jgi:8-oxo-dGTP pyrophosphatase MutT (NUDIX family)